MAVQNAGVLDAGPFETVLHVDGVIPPNGRAQAGGLRSPGSGELCVETPLPASGEHRLTAAVDELRGTFEQDESHNRFEQPYVASRVAPSHGPGIPIREGIGGATDTESDSDSDPRPGSSASD